MPISQGGDKRRHRMKRDKRLGRGIRGGTSTPVLGLDGGKAVRRRPAPADDAVAAAALGQVQGLIGLIEKLARLPCPQAEVGGAEARGQRRVRKILSRDFLTESFGG